MIARKIILQQAQYEIIQAQDDNKAQNDNYLIWLKDFQNPVSNNHLPWPLPFLYNSCS